MQFKKSFIEYPIRLAKKDLFDRYQELEGTEKTQPLALTDIPVCLPNLKELVLDKDFGPIKKEVIDQIVQQLPQLQIIKYFERIDDQISERIINKDELGLIRAPQSVV